MPLPIGHGLVGASVLLAGSDQGCGSLRNVVLTGAFLAIVPDIDVFFVWFLGCGESWHRSWSHSILFAVVAGLLASAIRGTTGEAWIYTGATLSHTLLDFFTTKRGGVELFWPFSWHRFSFGLFDYPSRPSHLFTLLMQSVGISFVELALFGPILLYIISFTYAKNRRLQN